MCALHAFATSESVTVLLSLCVMSLVKSSVGSLFVLLEAIFVSLVSLGSRLESIAVSLYGTTNTDIIYKSEEKNLK